jgi:hypothetical protein
MELVNKTISNETLKKMSEHMFDNLVKAVVDIEKEIMVVDAGLHADEEEFLLENDSEQKNLWGINLYPEHFGTEKFIVFDSMINLRPGQGNRSRGVDNPVIQATIKRIILKLVTP